MTADPQRGARYFCTKGKAGLGNRMLAAVTADLYAALSGRTLVVDWSDFTYSNDGSNAFPLLFDRAGSASELPDPDERSVDPPLWIGQLRDEASEVVEQTDPQDHAAPSGWRRYSTDLRRLDQPERVSMFWSYAQHIGLLRRHFTGEWASWAGLSDNAIVARVLRERMLLAPSIRASVDAFRKEHFVGETVGVHIRMTDRQTSLSSLLKRLDRVIGPRPDATIFLATDNKTAEVAIRDRYRRVVATQKWFPEGGAPMHHSEACPDRLTNAIEALIDMYLLAACDWLIYPGNSTFSQLSAIISTSPKGQVIDTERFDINIRAKRLFKSLMR